MQKLYLKNPFRVSTFKFDYQIAPGSFICRTRATYFTVALIWLR
jgi:hypothetical protein